MLGAAVNAAHVRPTSRQAQAYQAKIRRNLTAKDAKSLARIAKKPLVTALTGSASWKAATSCRTPRTRLTLLSMILTLVVSLHVMSQTNTPPNAAEWQTYAEKTNYRETPRYAETIEYSKRLADASPLIEFQSFGKSGEGRDLPLLIATEGKTFSP